jgi:hypothetical protein
MFDDGILDSTLLMPITATIPVTLFDVKQCAALKTNLFFYF